MAPRFYPGQTVTTPAEPLRADSSPAPLVGDAAACTFDAELRITDPGAVWDAASGDYAADNQGRGHDDVSAEIEEWLGTREAPNVAGCIRQLLDPGTAIKGLQVIDSAAKVGAHYAAPWHLFYIEASDEDGTRAFMVSAQSGSQQKAQELAEASVAIEGSPDPGDEDPMTIDHTRHIGIVDRDVFERIGVLA